MAAVGSGACAVCADSGDGFPFRVGVRGGGRGRRATWSSVKGLYAIVDVPHPHALAVEAVTRAVLGDRLRGGIDGAAVVQLRAKAATTTERLAMLEAMAPSCREAGVPLIVDDDIDAALEGPEGVTGVHLGQDDPGADDVASIRERASARGRALTIGLSTHDLSQLRAALRRGPDYVAFGPVLPTRSKARPDPVVGLSGLADACRTTDRPLVAIGGLDGVSAVQAVEVGADAVAVIGALVDATPERIAARAAELARSLREAARPLTVAEVVEKIPVLPAEVLEQLAAWGDDLGILLELGLPARFRPLCRDGQVSYRPCDVFDLLAALGKRPSESWSEWSVRVGNEPASPLVQLRRTGQPRRSGGD